MTLVIFELSIIELAISPVEFSFAILLTSFPPTLIHATILPLEIPIAFHLVIVEGALEDITSGGYTSPRSMGVSISKIALIDRSIRVDLNSLTLWLA
jgi:ABC-type methionine transport system permease subunit